MPSLPLGTWPHPTPLSLEAELGGGRGMGRSNGGEAGTALQQVCECVWLQVPPKGGGGRPCLLRVGPLAFALQREAR